MKVQVRQSLSEKGYNIDLWFSFISCNLSERAGNEDKLFSSLSGQRLRWMRQWVAWKKLLSKSLAVTSLSWILDEADFVLPASQAYFPTLLLRYPAGE